MTEFTWAMEPSLLVSSVLGHEDGQCEHVGPVTGGMSGASLDKYSIKKNGSDEERPVSVVVKHTYAAPMAATMGLAREASFYNTAGSQLGLKVPTVKCFYAKGDMATGEKVICMEDLSAAVQSGLYFGAHCPPNWGQDIATKTKHIITDTRTIVKLSAEAAAALHGAGHGAVDRMVAEHGWLRGSKWYGSAAATEGKKEWELGQAHVRATWTKEKEKEHQGESTWDAELSALIDASIAKAGLGYDAFLEELASEHSTIIHSDFHPGNCMLRRRSMGKVVVDVEDYRDGEQSSEDSDTADDDALDDQLVRDVQAKIAAGELREGADDGGADLELLLIDWELVGVGSGAQDLGQYMISHCLPEERERLEGFFLDTYYTSLTRVLTGRGVTVPFSRSELTRDYALHGVGKWLWLLVVMSSFVPAKAMQYFKDQTLAFARTHNVTPETVGAPRI